MTSEQYAKLRAQQQHGGHHGHGDARARGRNNFVGLLFIAYARLDWLIGVCVCVWQFNVADGNTHILS